MKAVSAQSKRRTCCRRRAACSGEQQAALQGPKLPTALLRGQLQQLIPLLDPSAGTTKVLPFYARHTAGSPGSAGQARARSPAPWSMRCTSADASQPCWTGTTSDTASTKTWGSQQRTGACSRTAVKYGRHTDWVRAHLLGGAAVARQGFGFLDRTKMDSMGCLSPLSCMQGGEHPAHWRGGQAVCRPRPRNPRQLHQPLQVRCVQGINALRPLSAVAPLKKCCTFISGALGSCAVDACLQACSAGYAHPTALMHPASQQPSGEQQH